MNVNDVFWTATFTIGFFVVLFILTRLKKKVLKEQGGIDMGLVVITLLPFLAYLIVSGKVAEFAVGDLKVVLAQEAKATSLAEITPQQGVEELLGERAPSFSKGSISELRERIIPQFREKHFTTMRIDRHSSSYYVSEVIREYLAEASRFDFFKYVVFSENDNFKGWMKAGNMLALLETRREQVADWINAGAWDKLAQEGMSTHSISSTSSAFDALNKFNQENLDDIAVVDAKNSYVGVLTREAVVSQVVARTVLGEK